MGLYGKVKNNLGENFSIFQFMNELGMDETDLSEARNILKQFWQMGYIKRISKNMYLKIR